MVLGQNWGQIMSNIVKKSKETGNIIRFSSYFTWDYLLKQEAVVVKSPEWESMAIIARNTKFYGMLGPLFCPIWVKNGKKTDSI